MWYIDWNTSFPSADCNTVDSLGAVPLITWEPWLSINNTLEAIGNGSCDAYVTKFAQDAKNWGKLVYLRFAHEMNGNWYPWDGYHNGGSAGAAKYITAWRHIHSIFDSTGASNVRWVWSINNTSVPGDSWNLASNYYPGDAYVDWIGMDGYNWGGGSWQSFDAVFGASYASLSAFGKPLMIAEFACAEDGVYSKADWITDAFSKIKNNYPLIGIFNWFNINKERDWRVDSSVSSGTAFQNAVSDPCFLDSKPSN